MLSENLKKSLKKALEIAKSLSHEYATLEHLMLAMMEDGETREILTGCGAKIETLINELKNFLHNDLSMLVVDNIEKTKPTTGLQRVINHATMRAYENNRSKVSTTDILLELFAEKESHTVFFLNEQNVSYMDMLNYINCKTVKGQDIDADIKNIGNINQPAYLLYSYPAPENKINEEVNETESEQKDLGIAKILNLKNITSSDSAFKENEVLAEYCTNLNIKAKNGRIDALIGRNKEVERTIHILLRRNKNNPLLIGEPGVGKTAIAEGLALKIINKQVPEPLANCIVYMLDMGCLLAGTRYRGDFEERMKMIIKEIEKNKHIILFIDEIHTIMGAGATNGGALDASNLLKPPLARGDIRCIGSTTYKEYTNQLCKDRALIRRFQQINIKEPSTKATIEILRGIKSHYEQYHQIKYTDAAIISAVKLSSRYIHEKLLPDKAIDVIDEAGAEHKIHNKTNCGNVTVKNIENTVARIANMPHTKISEKEIKVLKNLSNQIKQHIFGQDKAIENLCNSIKTSKTGLRNIYKPLGCYLFSGPSGVGKTETAKKIAESLKMNLIRIDMSEYSESHAVSKMVGAPPGYVGHDQGGLLTDPVSKNPYSVLLLDEIEKAHKDIYNLLLQIMDHGKITDSNGRQTNFQNVIIIMTTNAGSSDLDQQPVGFNSEEQFTEKLENNKEINKIFSPEFRNRINCLIQFKTLDENTKKLIIEKFIEQIKEQLMEEKINAEIDNSAIEHILQKTKTLKYGARKIESIINEEIKQHIADKIIENKIIKGSTIAIKIQNGECIISISSSKKARKKRGAISNMV
ncbi:ATP-dependent Clp protease ATP-binding subunit ClpA [Candidatus Xenohaliotis californiensis]|uniref:ATP-dependent Clp protease ATP-binding subunit ClpA n=1 Tax=Candidatus Xenohaliotis californiensis TaxID=84677 RepID=A0ABM9N9J9_9RICK|nr:ATP-dependent Clp protease ATP-binding subunit ClpA [Candidatus Xenohaliotis californiensis]